MVGKRDLNQLFFDVIDEFNAQTEQDKHLKQHADETLFGDGGVLDSLGLVNLITLVEEHVEDEFDVTITLADEKAMSRKKSPFRTVGSLIAYVSDLLEEHQDG